MNDSLPIATAPGGRSFLHHLRAMRSDMIGYLEHLARQGDFLRIRFGRFSVYFVNRPDYVREILVTQAQRFHKPGTVKRVARALFGQNLFTCDGEAWRVLRSAMQPAFHTRRVQSYANIMVKHTEEMLAGWHSGQTVNIPSAMMPLTLGITTKALFDQDLRDEEAGAAIVRFIELFNKRISSLVPQWFPTTTDRQLRRLIAIIDRLIQPLIDERRSSGEDKGDVLSMLLVAQTKDQTGVLTDHQVRNEMLNLFAAGYEVTAHTLAFTLYLIARHPDVEARLVAEVDNVLGRRRIAFADVPRLPYLEMVIKESMRLLPVTTVLARQAKEDVRIDGYRIGRNEAVLIAPWTLHRHPTFYEEPERFDPERFNPARCAQIPKQAYLPFSAGPRICIGNAFAMLQLRINLAMIVQQYRLTVAPGYTFKPIYRFNTRPTGGLPMVLQRR